MINAGIYLALMILFFLICINKKYNPLALCLVGYYLVIAIVSYYAGSKDIIEASKTSIFPYMLLLLAYILFFFPFLKKKDVISLEKLDYSMINKLKPFGIVYIVCSLICIYCYISPLRKLIQSGDWAMTRYMHYIEGNATVYTNIIERIGIAFTLYFYLLAVLVGILMIKEGTNTKFAYLLVGAAVISNFMQALYAVGRGTIFNDLMIVVILYLFIMNDIDKKQVYIGFGLILIALIIIAPYMQAITESRFSEDAGNELLRYFGEAPVVFNVNVATIDKLAWGRLLFSRALNTGFSQIDIGGTWGARFYTFVGFIYIDWGVLGVILFGVFWGLYFFERRVHRSVYKISDLFLIFYYYRFLLKGGLVIGSAFLQDAIFAGATYLFIKYIIERTNLPSIMFGDKRIL